MVGPLPPPMMGPAVATEIMRRAFETAGATVVHVNTADRRTVFNVGVLDARNVALALLHATRVTWANVRHPIGVVYIPISQGRWGYVRDALLISISRAFGRPIVVHLHGANLQEFFAQSTRAEQLVIKRTLGWSTLALALTPKLRRVYDGLVPPERVRVLENAIVDPWPQGVAHLVDARMRRAEEAAGELRILYLANDFAAKGYATLLRALTRPALESARVRMVGAPPEEVMADVRRLAASLGVDARVELTGGLVGEAKWREFESADVFAYPTENDGQPLAVIEAMAAGLPIVASTYGGIPDTLGDTGMLVEPGDADALADALVALIAEPQRRRALGEAARGRFAGRYTPKAFQRRFVAVFEEVLGRP